MRIGEAIALKWTDFADGQVHIARRIADGEVDEPKSKRANRYLPIDSSLIARLEALGKEGEHVFRSRNGGPLNPGNARKRYLHSACEELGIVVGGWHDFRDTLATTLRRNNAHPKVVSATLGQEKVTFASEVYDHASLEDMRGPLAQVAAQLLPTVTKSAEPET